MISPNKHIYLFIFCLFLFSNGFGQTASKCELSVYYNNPTDERAKKAITSSNFDISGFNDVLVAYFKDIHIKIDIVFFDVTQSFGLKMKNDSKHNLANEYVETWKTENSAEEKILMLFKKESESGEYIFNAFNVTDKIGNKQLYTVVTTFIQDQILKDDKSYATNKAKIEAGIYALQQAFDQKYKQMLVEKANDIFTNKRYFREYCYQTTYIYSFDSKINCGGESISYRPNENSDFETEEADNTRTSSGNSLNNTQSSYTIYKKVNEEYLEISCEDLFLDFDYYIQNTIGGELAYEKINKTNYSLIYLGETSLQQLLLSVNNTQCASSDYFDFANWVFDDGKYNTIEELKKTKTLTTYNDQLLSASYPQLNLLKNLDLIDKNSNHFKEWTDGKLIDNDNFYNYNKFCFTKVVLNTRLLQADERWDNIPIYNINGFASGWRPTRCNFFASDLSLSIFGIDPIINDRPVPNKYADLYLNYFLERNSTYSQIVGDENVIWKYINSGYPVYFTSPRYTDKTGEHIGHIEIGFPDGYDNKGRKKKYDDDYNHDLSSNKNTTQNACVGAGASIGYKDCGEYDWLMKNKHTKIFIYLGYLKLRI